MAANTDYVSTGKPKVGGGIYVAPVGTTLPTDATTDLAAAYKNLGYVSEDGLVNANSAESESIKAWGGDVVKTSQTEKSDTFQFKLIELLNEDVLKTVYGASRVKGTLATGITVEASSDEAINYTWVFEMVLTNGALKRIVVPKAKITEMDDIEYTDSDPAGYDITISAEPNSDSVTHFEYIQAATT